MEKRTNQKKQRRVEFVQRLKKAIAVFFCIALMIFFIRATDMSTRRMIMCSDDKYAMAVSLQEGNMLRLDIAGEKLMINIEPIIRVTDDVVYNSKRYYENVVKVLMAKFGT
jgi:hypothetical protein